MKIYITALCIGSYTANYIARIKIKNLTWFYRLFPEINKIWYNINFCTVSVQLYLTPNTFYTLCLQYETE